MHIGLKSKNDSHAMASWNLVKTNLSKQGKDELRTVEATNLLPEGGLSYEKEKVLFGNFEKGLWDVPILKTTH